MLELLFGICKVLLSVDHILVKRQSVRILDDLALLPLVVWEAKFVSSDSLSDLDIILCINNVLVCTKVWDKVVLFETVFLLVQILSAASRRTNWIGASLGVKLDILLFPFHLFLVIMMLPSKNCFIIQTCIRALKIPSCNLLILEARRYGINQRFIVVSKEVL